MKTYEITLVAEGNIIKLKMNAPNFAAINLDVENCKVATIIIKPVPKVTKPNYMNN